MRYFFPESEPSSDEKSGWCKNCGRRGEDSKHVKLFNNWICDLVQLENGRWIHSSRIYDAELAGHRVVYKLIEDV